MRFQRLFSPFVLFCALFLFIACASTKFSTIWKDETYKEHPKKILVINSFPNPATRRIFEDEFAEALKERGVDAVASYTIMPDKVVSDKDAIAGLAMQVAADTALISSSTGPKMDEIGDRNITTQSDVYDMKSNKLIFSSSASMRLQQTTPYLDQIQSYVKDLLNQFSRHGLL